jgi:hypothetical protein
MKLTQFVFRIFALSLLFAGALAMAAPVTGTVTNKTTGKPAVGDPVVLVDVQAGMGEVATTTTDAHGHYTLKTPGNSNYLVRVTHQGSTYFIGAPQGGASGDLTVYDVAAKVQGVSIEADVLEMESDNGQLRVIERYFVHNTSSPPLTQWSQRSFEIVLPPEAVLAGAEAQRPSGLPTSIKLDPNGAKGHYSFNFPIQPDQADKSTLFQISYSVPYSTGKFNFKAQMSLPTENLAVLLPMSMVFAGGAGAEFRSVKEDPGIQTFIAKNVPPGKVVEYAISGTGQIPREQQGAPAAQQADTGIGSQEGSSPEAGTPSNRPGGGIGNPINTPDPLSKYKWWILGALALLLAAGAAFLLRKPAEMPAAATAAQPAPQAAGAPPAPRQGSLLDALKEEMFALESERLSGTIQPAQYAEVKAALETVLRRALNRK